MIIKSKNTDNILLPSKAYLFDLATKLAEESAIKLIKKIDLMDD